MRIVLLIVVLIVWGCSKSNDKKVRDISFLSSDTTYSFALENSNYMFHELYIIVKTSEKSASASRYSLTIDENSDITPDDLHIETDFTINENSLTDTLKVVLYRTEKIKTQSILLHLRLNSGGNFRASGKSDIQIHYDDITVIPYWWNDWKTHFGEYQKEKFSKWKEIYYEGVDGEYYWNNMPKRPIIENYPGTFFYIGKLKRYFEENVVYPDGDITQERISLP